MRLSFRVLGLCLLSLAQNLFAAPESPSIVIPNVHLAVHGGTGVPKGQLTPEKDKALREGLAQALQAGHKKLLEGATSLDAVETAVRVLEDNPLFNAGKGAVFTAEGKNELDASIMEGKTLKAGAVAGVTTAKNPITLARAVMEKTPHVILSGKGADAFAKEVKVETVKPAYYWTQYQWDELQKKLKANVKPKGHGTVGAIALDSAGNLSAATSTGGMTGKRPGRLGDSPIVGAGTYADNQSAAISGTGWGEFFIRFTVAHDVAALVKYKNLKIEDAAKEVIQNKVLPAGGEGGVIVLDPKGNFAFSYASDALYRGAITRDGKVTVALYEN